MNLFRACICCVIYCLVVHEIATSAAIISPVKRTTVDRDGDLVNAMIDAGMLDHATRICETQRAKFDAQSDPYARWTIRFSKVLVARNLESDDFDDAAIASACAPLAELIGQYPDHSRHLFLQIAMFEVRWEAARHDVVIASVRPSGNDRETRALQRITQLSDEAETLVDQIQAARSNVEMQDDARTQAERQSLRSDLLRLQQELQVSWVSIELLQSELFFAGSKDYIAAATNAIHAAEKAIASLPADCAARKEVERIRIQAILRSGDHRQARSELSQRSERSQQADWGTDPLVQAIDIRIDLAAAEFDSAKRKLDAFYGQTPADAPRSVELDLTRLAYLIETDDAAVGPWLDEIEKRSGAYAKRRAEAISLHRLRSGASESAVAPALVAAQGQDWLRRGDAGRAADLLAAAARAESDPDQAIAYARQAAAVFVSVNRNAAAADLLSETASAKPTADLSAAVKLQAALLYSKSDLERAAERVEQSLRETITVWPGSDPAAKSRLWLIELLTRQNRRVEAADVALSVITTQAEFDRAYELWRNVFHSFGYQDDSSSANPIANNASSDNANQWDDSERRFVERLTPLTQNAVLRDDVRRAVILLLDRDSLGDIAFGFTDTTEEPFVDAMWKFRRTGVVSSALQQPIDQWSSDAAWRLMRDATTDPSRREVTARLIQQWNDESGDSMDQALRLVWLNEVPAAITMLRRLIDQSETPGAVLRSAAKLLGGVENVESRKVAVTFWDQLAAGLRKGSDQWHDAKLSGIALLARNNNRDEAIRRAKYTLLTSPPQDESLRKRYERFAK
mgnify:CR=1 FL=1|tara:strand:+ start:522451 stop:524853 length:2403 start_codon:yes stop_codon:yes gene_type:complete